MTESPMERLRRAERETPMPDWSRLHDVFVRGPRREFSVPPSLVPYVKLVTPSGRRGIEIGVKGTF